MLAKLTGALDQLSSREKVAVGGMGGALFLFVVFLGVVFIGGELSEQRGRIERQREAIATLMSKKDAFLAAQAKSAGADQAKIEGNNLNLTTFADQHAKAVGIEFKDYNDSKRPLFLKKRIGGGRADEKPDLIEEQLEVTFRRTSLSAVTAFLDRVDGEAKRPVAVKKLDIKTLWSDRAKLSGSITMATWKKPQVEEDK